MNKLLERMSHTSILVADGATGTQLQKAGLPPGSPSELWVLQNPDGVRNLHRSYIDAGSDIVLTDTFGGSRLKLNRNGMGDQVIEINQQAARLAREVAGDKVIVLGDIGPTGELMEPMGSLTYEQAVATFAEQAAGLVAGGVDAILIETMSDLNEAKAAVEGVHKATDLPLLVTMSFESRGRTMMGVKPEVAAKELWEMGVTAVGANCGRTLTETFDAVQAMHQAVPEAVLMAKPNAGLPHVTDGESTYDVTPEVMAEHATRFADLGVKIFGGCCGSNPDHIKAVAEVLHSR
jgi:5-methyltetrahydrofolate--homocysteine methyltransferase